MKWKGKTEEKNISEKDQQMESRGRKERKKVGNKEEVSEVKADR